MKLRIRSKADGQLRVYDELGNAVDGVKSVEMSKTALGETPQFTIVMAAEVAVDTDADVRPKTNRMPAAYSGRADQWPGRETSAADKAEDKSASGHAADSGRADQWPARETNATTNTKK